MRSRISSNTAYAYLGNTDVWKMAGVVPLYKRKSDYQAWNYTGIHITSQISKIAERVLASMVVPQLIWSGAYGRNQFANMLECGARDALAHLIIIWLLQFCRKRKIAMYCSDVSEAFDKANSIRRMISAT